MSITVKIIADSISPQGVRLTTYELEYPRFIHAEVMTHRVFSRNAQSSRAVPVDKSLKLDYIVPVIWGKNKPGMSSHEELDEQSQRECGYYWHALVRYTKDFSEKMSKAGLHKQWANRPLEWFTPIKVVVTATEWDNFFWLRDDPEAAQPEIVILARKMKEALAKSTPQLLNPGEWHLPYVVTLKETGKPICYMVDYGATWTNLDLEKAKKVSAGCCAAVSYRNQPSVEKCLEIYDKLFIGPKPHLSPVEHQATPIAEEVSGNWGNKPADLNRPDMFDTWEPGITHVARNGQLWSGNLKGWVQLRQTM